MVNGENVNPEVVDENAAVRDINFWSAIGGEYSSTYSAHTYAILMRQWQFLRECYFIPAWPEVIDAIVNDNLAQFRNTDNNDRPYNYEQDGL
jgi:hypothetical protein